MSRAALTDISESPAHADRLQRLILRRVWSSLWRHLPALAVSGAITAAAVLFGYRVVGGPWAVTPLVVALVAGPTLMPLFNVAQGALVDDDTELRRYVRDLPRYAMRSTGYTLVAGLCLSALLGAVEMYEARGDALGVASLAASAAGTVIALLGLMALLPAAVARPRLRGTRLWATSLHLVGRWPVRFLAPFALMGLVVGCAVNFTTSLVLLLPVPVALVASASYWCCAVDLGATDITAPGPNHTV